LGQQDSVDCQRAEQAPAGKQGQVPGNAFQVILVHYQTSITFKQITGQVEHRHGPKAVDSERTVENRRLLSVPGLQINPNRRATDGKAP
jgi:hypothetical protein